MNLGYIARAYLINKQTKTKKKRGSEIGQCPMSKKERGVVSGIAVGCSVC